MRDEKEKAVNGKGKTEEGPTMPSNTNTTAVTVTEKNISDGVLMRIGELEKSGGLQIPKNYSPANALKSAWLILQNTVDRDKNLVLQVCTKESIANTLLDMVIQGLSPAKKQCYFIAYGKTLQLSRSYFGSIAVTKSLKGIKDVFANCIYDGDEFEYTFDLETGVKKIVKHNQQFTNIKNSKLLGAYALIIREDLPPYVEIMNMDQIRAAWEQGAAKGNSGAHQKFSEEMAKKSVINRACKIFWNTSNDSDLLIDAINKTTDVEDLPDTPYVVEEDEIEKEVEQNANKETLDFKAVEQEQPAKAEQPANSANGLSPDEWESPIAVIAKLESFKKAPLKAFDKFCTENESRLSAFGGKHGEAIENTIKAVRTGILKSAGF